MPGLMAESNYVQIYFIIPIVYNVCNLCYKSTQYGKEISLGSYVKCLYDKSVEIEDGYFKPLKQFLINISNAFEY